MTRRLYLRLYVTLLVSALVCLALVAVAFRVVRDTGVPPVERIERAAQAFVEAALDIHAPDAQARLTTIADAHLVDMIAGDAQGAVIGVPTPHAFPVPRRRGLGLGHDRMGPVLVTSLDGDGWLVVRPRPPYRRLRLHPFFSTLIVLAVVMAVGSIPVARRMARRLEQLAVGVKRWGEGDLRHRVAIQGNDEIATLAATFNQAAEHVDALLERQKQMLANASHELRSPLARLRMGLELVAEEPEAARREALVEQIRGDVVELDSLIEEVLLFARSDAGGPSRPFAPVDLRALIADEAARTGATVTGGPVVVEGDAVMLRHLVRNLLENARHHGGGGAVRATVSADDQRATLSVEDEGPGVPPPERENIFAPFYRIPGRSSVGSGHGIGLALVRQVARHHGGDVHYQDRVPQGSHFKVTLPLTHSR